MPGETAVGRRHGRRQRDQCAHHRRSRTLEPISAAAVAHHAVPRQQPRRPSQLVNGRTDYDGVLLGRRPARVIGLWSSFAWENGRELQQENRGVAIGIVQDMLRRVQSNAAAAFARSGIRAAAAVAARASSGSPDEWIAEARHSRARSSARCCRSCEWWAARRPSAVLQAGRHRARHRRARWSRASAKWSCAVADKTAGQGHGVARRRGEDARRRHRGADRHRHRPHRAVGRRHAAGCRIARWPRSGASRRSASTSAISPTVRRRHVMACIPGRRIVEVDGVPTPEPRCIPRPPSQAGRTVRRSGCARSPGTTPPK